MNIYNLDELVLDRQLVMSGVCVHRILRMRRGPRETDNDRRANALVFMQPVFPALCGKSTSP